MTTLRALAGARYFEKTVLVDFYAMQARRRMIGDPSELTSATSVGSFYVVFHIQHPLRACAVFWAAPVNI